MILEAGPLLLLLAIVLMSGILLTIFSMIVESQDWELGLLMLLLPFSLHWQRKDRAIIDLIPVWPPLLYFLEYLLVCIPFFGLLVYSKNYSAISALLLGLMILTFLPKKPSYQAEFQSRLFQFISLDAFELRIGFRRKQIAVLFLLVLGLATPWLIAVMPLLVLFLSVIVVGFFDDFEPKEVLEKEDNIARFLWQKVGINLAYVQLIWSPYYLLFLIFHTSFWYFILLAMLYSSLWIAFAIFYKYAQYSPFQAKANSGTIIGIFGVLALIPFTAPINLIALVIYYHKAKKRLSFNALNYARS